MTIKHGLQTHPFFSIAQPVSAQRAVMPEDKPKIIELIDKDNKTIQVELHDSFTFDIEDLKGMNAFCLLSYGLPASKLIPVLVRRYPEIEKTKQVRFLLLKKLQ